MKIESIQPASLAGNSYLDLDDDGILDPTDIGLGQTRIELEGEDIWGNTVSRVMLTNTHGEYSFDDLVPGTYTVRKVQPFAFVDVIWLGSSKPESMTTASLATRRSKKATGMATANSIRRTWCSLFSTDAMSR